MKQRPRDSTAPRDPPRESGRVLGERYVLLRRIGRGRTADVYEARDRASGERIALERLRRGMSRDDALRFRREYHAPGSTCSRWGARLPVLDRRARVRRAQPGRAPPH